MSKEYLEPSRPEIQAICLASVLEDCASFQGRPMSKFVFQ